MTITPPLSYKTYVRSRQPTVPGSERLWTDNELARIQDAFNSINASLLTLIASVNAIEAHVP
jgi:hypothetical protein